MSLQETLKQIIREQGREVLQKPELLAVLEDYQAYADESPATRAIVQQLVRSGAVRTLVMARRSEAELFRNVGYPVFDYCNVHGRHPFIDLLCILL